MTRRAFLFLAAVLTGMVGGCIRRPRRLRGVVGGRSAEGEDDEPCRVCKGAGKLDCFHCKGRGKVQEWAPAGKIVRLKDCQSCNGSGSHVCISCGGKNLQ